jgi:hypothetical protein
MHCIIRYLHYAIYNIYILVLGYAVAQLVEALR